MLTLASNRDEYYQRPTQNAHFWEDSPHIFGGRDLKMKGSWLALSKNGRLAAVTNYREPNNSEYDRSRGEIPASFLDASESAIQFARSLPKSEYAGFNALLFDGKELVYCHNRGEENNDLTLAPGQYGLSNHLLDTPWPKVRKTKPALKLSQQEPSRNSAANILLNTLGNNEHASREELPITGIAPEIELMLSPAFIVSPGYGTRTSSIVILEQVQNKPTLQAYFWERLYREGTTEFEDKQYQLELSKQR
jgi:uncharacterized protein with NRDE domain